ncbi:hypothetical protein CPU12_07770 [Malaciobacter molluscorum LMG 25693]|uniref:Ankyrin domain-containing protein n=1 Tax=Malaciobacter molluscorum LMG 25693 TaxID=870501 RepID=A0A2G1DHM0_9BACT|nr:ankyrin repeat domain-containing protein [Malaciobacter molluscorum]AXX93331.1 ankyrin domain-containing protein [Malaciobacter molluscorum LMG 25693]PHO17985.1 hypothetical protein CPU12_07770 [Malaciobacter molluscorum LMG 25693]
MQLKNIFPLNNDENLNTLIKKGKINKIIKYLDKNSININDNIEEYLSLAIKSDNSNFLEYLSNLNIKIPKNIDNLNILSFTLNKTTNLDIISYIIKNNLFSKEYEYGLSPFETALEINADFKIFKLLIDNNILQNSISKLPIIHQLVENDYITYQLKIDTITYLLRNKQIDLNEEIIGQKSLLEKAYDIQNKYLIELFLSYKASVKPIYEVYGNIFLNEKEISKMSSVLLENQPFKDYKYFSRYLTFKDFKSLLFKFDDIKNMEILILICKNVLILNNEKIELFKIALEKGCDINEISDDIYQYTALQYYCTNYKIRNDFSFIDFLFDNGAVFNFNNNSPLADCIYLNQINLIKYLVKEKNIDINELNRSGIGAINGLIGFDFLENTNDKIKMLELLVKLGLDINQKVISSKKQEYPKSSIIDILIKDKRNHEFLEYILKTYKDLKIEDEISYMFAFEPNDVLCKLLIEKNPYYTSDFYYSKKIDNKEYKFSAQALDMAIDWKRHELAQYLIEKYPNMKTYTEHSSLIDTAFTNSFSIEFIKKLIDKDPNLDRLYYKTKIYPSTKEEVTTKETSLISILSHLKNISFSVDKITEIVDYLLENNANANIPLIKEGLGHSAIKEEHALLYAAKENMEKKLLDTLIDKGNIDLNEKRSGRNESLVNSYLSIRTLSDDSILDHLKYFSKKCKIDLEQQDIEGNTLFLKASSNCLPKCLQYLIELGSNIDIIGGFDNSPAIHKAISNYPHLDKTKRAQTVKVLIDAGVDLEQFDSEQLTALMSASKYGCFESLVTLLENGANPNSKNETNANAANVLIPSDVYTKNYSYDDKENFEENKSKILAVLKDYGCDLDNVPLEGSTILNNAIGYNLKTIFNTLLQLDIDINKPDRNGTTPIMVAIEFGDIYFVNSLLQNPNINLLVEDNAGENLIYKAIKRENDSKVIDLIDYLVENGVPIKNLENGMNPLIFASYFSHFNLFEYLLNFVDDINTKDSFGLSAISWTLQSNLNIPLEQRLEAIKTLVALNADKQEVIEIAKRIEDNYEIMQLLESI